MGSKTTIRPPRLSYGTRVALVAPAGPLLELDDQQRAAELCRALGWEPVLAPNAGAQHGYLAGTDAQRLGDLNNALGDDSIGAIWCIRGGTTASEGGARLQRRDRVVARPSSADRPHHVPRPGCPA